MLWGGHLWTTGYYINAVGAYASEDVIRTYIENQGKQYQKIYKAQLSFPGFSNLSIARIIAPVSPVLLTMLI